MFDFDHPFFRPLWIRCLVVAFCLGWAAVEVAAGTIGWAMLFGGLGAIAAWKLLVAYRGGGES